MSNYLALEFSFLNPDQTLKCQKFVCSCLSALVTTGCLAKLKNKIISNLVDFDKNFGQLKFVFWLRFPPKIFRIFVTR